MKRDTVITFTLVICALTTTAAVVHREFVALTVPSRPETASRPVFIESWISQLAQGVRIGSTSAPVQLIEFADFECPFCGSLHQSLKSLRERYPTEVSLIYMHFPLKGHRFALPAARVAECAGDQGRFEPMYDLLFEKQDSFGLKPWTEYATEAGVPDLAAFDACIKRTDPIPRVEEGKRLGAEFDVKGTPTVIINGWKLGRPPAEKELDQMVQRILAGKQPVDGKS
jgi:protein-disulfide isomerase